MPNTKSAEKRLRQNADRRQKNRTKRTVIRSTIRRVRAAVAEGKLDDAEKEYRVAAKKLDQAGAKNLIHRNTAARTKSRLQKLIKEAKAS